jgi:hypothetical protein
MGRGNRQMVGEATEMKVNKLRSGCDSDKD